MAALVVLGAFFGFAVYQVAERSRSTPALSTEERSITAVGLDARGIGDAATPASVAGGVVESDLVSGSAEPPGTQGDSDDQSPFTLRSFKRSEVRDGKKIWELVAAEGRYFPELNRAEVREPELILFTEEGDKIRVTANSAKLHLSGMGVDRVVLEGNVQIVRNDEVTIRTEEVEYDKANGQVHGKSVVTLHSPTFDVSGVGVFVDVASKLVRLTSHVESVVRPKGMRDGEANGVG
jgi:LPS export ABC transporter protein LptC